MMFLEDVAALQPVYDLVVIGAGPAGMAAATEAATQGLSVAVLDEAPSPGGQIYRAIAEPPAHFRTALGASYWRGAALIRAFQNAAGDYLPRARVWHLNAAREVAVSANGKSRLITGRHVVVATGALERPVPVKGWTLPGVMTAGAAQILLKGFGIVATGRVMLAGSGPLLWLLAAQYVAAGQPPSLILDTTERAGKRAALVHLPGFLLSPYVVPGLGLLGKVRRRVPVVSGVSHLEVAPSGQKLRVAYEVGDSRTRSVEVEHVFLHQGVVPDVNLVSAAGCTLAWNAQRICWEPTVDRWGRSSVSGIAIAGDGAGIAGAQAAACRGQLAGLEAARALGKITEVERDHLATTPLRTLSRYRRGRAFLDRLYRPSPVRKQAPAEAIACRCEEVTVQQIRDAVALGATGPNQVKAFLRCGMGPCQGRFCSLTVTQIIAAARGVTPAEVGSFRLRTPVKPITLGELASLPQGEADVHAVVRG